MSERRGLYRGVYSAMLDHPDYQTLSAAARLTVLTLRLCTQNTVASIFRYYPTQLQVQTGQTGKVLEAALVELESGHWIERDGVVLWIKNGLRYDPYIRLSDDKHRLSVLRALESLPTCAIVTRFCDYYKIRRPSAGSPKGLRRVSQGSSKGHRRGSEDPSPPIPIPIPNPIPSTKKNSPPTSPLAASPPGPTGDAHRIEEADGAESPDGLAALHAQEAEASRQRFEALVATTSARMGFAP